MKLENHVRDLELKVYSHVNLLKIFRYSKFSLYIFCIDKYYKYQLIFVFFHFQIYFKSQPLVEKDRKKTTKEKFGMFGFPREKSSIYSVCSVFPVSSLKRIRYARFETKESFGIAVFPM